MQTTRTYHYVEPEKLNNAISTEPLLVDKEKANLISSRLEDGRHLPVLDIDFEARLVPSSTPGHYHLYLDGLTPMDWEHYERLIDALTDAGVIQPGFAYWSKRYKASYVRMPGVSKPEGAKKSS